jgi:hypothetical protein
MCFSYSMIFSILSILQVLQFSFLIFLVFQCFFSIVHVLQCVLLILMIFSFLAILKVLECAFFVFHLFEYFLPYSRSNSACVTFSTFISFLPIFQVLQCFSFFMFFSVACHISCPTVRVSHFPRFPVLLPYSMSYTVHFLFFTFFNVLALIDVLQCVFLIFQHIQVSRHRT